MVMDKLMRKLNTNPPVKKKLARPSVAVTNTFGVALKHILERDQSDIPIIVLDIFDFFSHGRCFETEGVFRINGNSRTIDLVRHWIDEAGSDWYVSKLASLASDTHPGIDVHCITGLLKLYLRELPDGLVPTNLTSWFIETLLHHRQDQATRFSRYVQILSRLPPANYTLLQHLCQFLHKVWRYRSTNKMSTECLGIIFGPNVFRVEDDMENVDDQNSANQIMCEFIEHSGEIFRMSASTSQNVTKLSSKTSLDQMNLKAQLQWKSHDVNWNSYNRNSVSSTSDSLSTTLNHQDSAAVAGDCPTANIAYPPKTKYVNDLSIGLAAAIKVCIEEHLFRTAQCKTVGNNDLRNDIDPMNQIHNPGPGSLNMPSPTNEERRVPNHQIDRGVSDLSQRLQHLKLCLHDYECEFENRWGRKPSLVEKRSDLTIRNIMKELNELRADIKYLKDSPTNASQVSHGSLSQGATSIKPQFAMPTSSAPDSNLQTKFKTLPNSCNVDRLEIGNVSSSGIPHTHLPTNSRSSRFSSGYGTITKDPPHTSTDHLPGGAPLPEPRSPLNEIYSTLMLRLSEKRASANRPDDLRMMTPEQIEAEKLSLQKALLYFENLHGRPQTRQERFVMRPLYDRYRNVKRLLNGSRPPPSSNTSDVVETIPSDDQLPLSSDGDLCNERNHNDKLSKSTAQTLSRPTTTPSVSVGSSNAYPRTNHPRLAYSAHSNRCNAIQASFSSGDEEFSTTHSPPRELKNEAPTHSYPGPTYLEDYKSSTNQCSSNGDNGHEVTGTTHQYNNLSYPRDYSAKPIHTNPSENKLNRSPINLQHRTTISAPLQQRSSSRDTLDHTFIRNPDLTTWTLGQLHSEINQLLSAKRDLQKCLKDFENNFERSTGHKVERADRLCMRAEYNQYRYIKTRLGELESELNSRPNI